MDTINQALKGFIADVTNLNAMSTYLILGYIEYKIDMIDFNSKNDSYLYKMPSDLISEPALIDYNRDIINSVLLGDVDNKTPKTIKDLLVIAINDKSNYFFWQKPIKTIKKFLLSIQSEQLEEVAELKKLLTKHNAKNQNSHLLIELKNLIDRYVSELIGSYFEFEKQLANTEYAEFLYCKIQDNTEIFINQVDDYINKIGIEGLSIRWFSIKYIFLDFLKCKNKT